LEVSNPEAAGAGGRPVLLTPVGLRPPSVSKTDLRKLELIHLFYSLTSLTNEHFLPFLNIFLGQYFRWEAWGINGSLNAAQRFGRIRKPRHVESGFAAFIL
jgi:hypothetical protein